MIRDDASQKEEIVEKKSLKLISPVTGRRVLIRFPFVTNKSYNAAKEFQSSIRFIVKLIPTFLGNLQKLNELLESSACYEALLIWSRQFNYDAKVFRRRNQHPRACQALRSTRESLLKHVLQVVYNSSVLNPAKLNIYPPSTSSVYGETSTEMVEEIINRLNITSNDSFLDLGSGVGQVVLHIAAATQCRVAVGIECREWPLFYSKAMDSSFRRWMKWYGIPYQRYELLEGDFMDEKFRHYINEATIIFINNIAFTPALNYQLEEIFLTLDDGVRIVSSREFAAPDLRLNARNVNDFCAIVKVESLRPAPVSWTSKMLPYFVHTIDRRKRAEYLASRSSSSATKKRFKGSKNSQKKAYVCEAFTNGEAT